jgi:hypothetical protein
MIQQEQNATGMRCTCAIRKGDISTSPKIATVGAITVFQPIPSSMMLAMIGKKRPNGTPGTQNVRAVRLSAEEKQ